VFSSPTSRWTAGAAAAGLGLVAVTYVAVIGPKRSEAADLADSATAVQQQNDALQIRIAQLKAQFATLPQRQAELSTMLGQIPVTADVPHFVRSLDALASGAGVTLDGVTPQAAQVLAAQGASAPAAAGTAGSPAASGGTGPGGTGATGGTGAATGTGGTGAATGAAGGANQIVAVPVTVTVHGPYFKAVTFLKRLQSGQRAFLVTGLQIAVAGSDVTLTVKGRIFAVPGAAQALAAAAASPAAAAPGSASAPGATTPAAPAPLPNP
jgi:hypothetical protein